SRREAKAALDHVAAGGGTAIGTWLNLASGLFRDAHGINHAILLTDGQNTSEEPEDLVAAIAAATGVFQCDCRGVGTAWAAAELRPIAVALLGSVDIVAEPADLAADFTAMMRTAMGKEVGSVRLRLWTPAGAEIGFVKQVAPDIVDLTPARVDVNDMTGEYLT